MLGYSPRLAHPLMLVELHGGYPSVGTMWRVAGPSMGRMPSACWAMCRPRLRPRVATPAIRSCLPRERPVALCRDREEDDRRSMVFTLIVPARSDSCPPSGARRRRQGRGGRAGRGARSARNLDAAEHARTMAGRSERSHSRQHTLTLVGLRRLHAVAHVRSPSANCCEGGATSPQGTNVDQTCVDVFDRRGRRSPLVSRPEGRPRANAEQGRSCW